MSRISASLGRMACRLLVGLTAGLVISIAPLSATAEHFSKVVVFGDSLSDNGNLYRLSNNTFPPFPYFQGRFSNGRVWVEDLAARLDVPLEDHAYGGAYTSTRNFNNDVGFVPGAPGMQTVFDDYIAMHPRLDPKALYIVWGGGNDYLNGFQNNPFIPVGNLMGEIGTLAAKGARTFLIPNLPDLGSLPGTLDLPLSFQELFNQLTAAHNAILAGAIQNLRSAFPGDKFYLMDDNTAVRNIRSNPAAYGFTDVSNRAISVFPASASGYLFWDDVHPTAAGHIQLSNLAFDIVHPDGDGDDQGDHDNDD